MTRVTIVSSVTVRECCIEKQDEPGNAMDATTRNAEAETVANRVAPETPDIRELPPISTTPGCAWGARRTTWLGWRMWWGGPWMVTLLVTVQKPAYPGMA